ncbi:unnamed protein product [Calypogeia fissa]
MLSVFVGTLNRGLHGNAVPGGLGVSRMEVEGPGESVSGKFRRPACEWSERMKDKPLYALSNGESRDLTAVELTLLRLEVWIDGEDSNRTFGGGDRRGKSIVENHYQ